MFLATPILAMILSYHQIRIYWNIKNKNSAGLNSLRFVSKTWYNLISKGNHNVSFSNVLINIPIGDKEVTELEDLLTNIRAIRTISFHIQNTSEKDGILSSMCKFRDAKVIPNIELLTTSTDLITPNPYRSVDYMYFNYVEKTNHKRFVRIQISEGEFSKSIDIIGRCTECTEIHLLFICQYMFCKLRICTECYIQKNRKISPAPLMFPCIHSVYVMHHECQDNPLDLCSCGTPATLKNIKA